MYPKLRSIIAASFVGLLANSAGAADGTINFTGELVAASCSVSAGAGTSVVGKKGDQVIDVNLGKVSTDSLKGLKAIPVGGEAGIAAGTAININVDCDSTANGLTTVKLKFDPYSGSGVDLKNNSLLKTSGTSKGVGIGIYNVSNELINLAGNGTLDTALSKSGTGTDTKYKANLNLRAAYVTNGDAIVPGTANGQLPFTLSYQ